MTQRSQATARKRLSARFSELADPAEYLPKLQKAIELVETNAKYKTDEVARIYAALAFHIAAGSLAKESDLAIKAKEVLKPVLKAHNRAKHDGGRMAKRRFKLMPKR